MNSHKHARLTRSGRALLVDRVRQEGWTVVAAAHAAGVSRRTAYKWLARFRTEGPCGLLDRSSRPHRSPQACSADQVHLFEQRRRARLPLWRIARDSGRSLATVARHVARLGLSRLPSLQPVEPIRRYERERPGELLHINTKRLGRIEGVGHRITGDRTLNRRRGKGWEAVHLAIDDHSRVSFARMLADYTLSLEFRHSSWFNDRRREETLGMERELGLVNVVLDEPQGFTNSVGQHWEVTNPKLAVVRLHGRNAETWNMKGATTASDRFNYDYSDAELRELAGSIAKLAKSAMSTHVIFNNNYEDHRQRNARSLMTMLGLR